MQQGWLNRSFEATLQNNITIKVNVKRFLSLKLDEIGAINYEITPLNTDANISFTPYIDAGITNHDTNWNDQFWDILDVQQDENQLFIVSKTMKTGFYTCTFMQSQFFVNGNEVVLKGDANQTEKKASITYQHSIKKNQTFCYT